MRKQHPCIPWCPILRDKCCNLCIRNKTKSKACVQAIKEEGPINPAVGTITNTLTGTAKDWDWARIYAEIRAFEKGRPLPDLPLDIIVTNIFTRLPAKCIFQLWQHTDSSDVLYGLIMHSNFIHTHLARGGRTTTPTIVMQSLTRSIGNVIKLFVSEDGKAENIKPITNLDLSSCNNAYNCTGPFTVCGSCDGFLLFRCIIGPELFCIWNPITKEKLIVTPDSGYTATHVCGFYFHPLRKEYEVVCARMLLGRKMWEFQILSLRTKRRRSVGSCCYRPSRIQTARVFINGTFYWIVDSLMYRFHNHVSPSPSDSILSFNVETEEFSTMEVVNPSNDSVRHWKRPEDVFHLFELEGRLCLFDSLSKTDGALIWEHNFHTKLWVKKYSMTSPVNRYWSLYSEIEYIKTTGELIAYDSMNGRTTPYIYNLRSGIWRRFDRKGFEGDEFKITSTHIDSLVSLDVEDSVIPIEW